MAATAYGAAAYGQVILSAASPAVPGTTHPPTNSASTARTINLENIFFIILSPNHCQSPVVHVATGTLKLSRPYSFLSPFTPFISDSNKTHRFYLFFYTPDTALLYGPHQSSASREHAP